MTLSSTAALDRPLFVTVSLAEDLPDRLRMPIPESGIAGNPTAIRVVPLLRVFTVAAVTHIAIGVVFVTVRAPQSISCAVLLNGVWVGTGGSFTPLDLSPTGNESLSGAVETALTTLVTATCAPSLDLPETDNEHIAAFIAKGLAEAARNSVAAVREARYALELQLAETSVMSPAQSTQGSVVAALLQLGIICGRSADTARDAEREGFHVFLTDSTAYHSYRRVQDPTLIGTAKPATAGTRAWMRLHDTAVRQCRALHSQLDAEGASVHALLAAAASVSSSREADAQASFTTLAAVASLGLGIPALVLALYGADRLLPLDTWPRQLAFIPVAVGLVVATVVAIRRAPGGSHRRVWYVGPAAMLLGLLGLLVLAGLIAPVA